VDRRCDKIQADAADAASALRSAFGMQMAKLPRRIRAMKMKDFIEQCGGSVMQAVSMLPRARQAGAASGRGPAPMATVARPQAGARAPVATARRPVGGARPPLGGSTVPNAAGRVPKTPGVGGRLPSRTPAGARLARADEVFVSANGSPVVMAGAVGAVSRVGAPATGVRATIGKSRAAVSKVRRGGAAEPPASDSVAIDVAIGDGREVDLARPEVQAALTAEDKEAARAKLLALQSQLASILTSLDG